jgi:hypothetical protein
MTDDTLLDYKAVEQADKFVAIDSTDDVPVNRGDDLAEVKR